jgi:hypothetical protein
LTLPNPSTSSSETFPANRRLPVVEQRRGLKDPQAEFLVPSDLTHAKSPPPMFWSCPSTFRLVRLPLASRACPSVSLNSDQGKIHWHRVLSRSQGPSLVLLPAVVRDRSGPWDRATRELQQASPGPILCPNGRRPCFGRGGGPLRTPAVASNFLLRKRTCPRQPCESLTHNCVTMRGLSGRLGIPRGSQATVC